MTTATHSTRCGDFQAVETRGGSEVYVLPTRKFKTKLVRIHLRTQLSTQNLARALAQSMLRRGTRRLPSMVDVSRALEGLYGTSWSSAAYKLGDEQVLSFRLDAVEERFLPGKPAVFAPALALAHDLLLDPHLVGGRFPDDVFRQERLNHRREIEAQYNDKLTWAFQRLLDLMFPDEPYGRPVLGTLADADAVTAEQVLAAWKTITTTLPARIFAVGDFQPEEVARFVEELLPLRSEKSGAAGSAPKVVPNVVPRIVVEPESVAQSKLVSGRLVDLSNLGEREFDALRVFAGVLGGGFHSRMFQTIREKHSLAYFASSSLDRLRGVLYTSCGIDAAARGQVTDLVEAQIQALQSAPPRDDELDQTRRLIVSGTRGTSDSAGGMVETLEAGLAARRVRTLEEIARSVAAVTAADVQQAARRIGPPRVIYCLEGTVPTKSEPADTDDGSS